MTAEALDALESRSPIVIDGPFARNELYCCAAGGVAAWPKGLRVAAAGGNGRRRGRARADESRGRTAEACSVELKPHAPAAFAGLRQYHSTWQAKARAGAR
jgi:hypothetical protein